MHQQLYPIITNPNLCNLERWCERIENICLLHFIINLFIFIRADAAECMVKWKYRLTTDLPEVNEFNLLSVKLESSC